MAISIDILARTEQAQKELGNLGKVIERSTKAWEGLMGGKGRTTTASNLQQMSKGMQALAKGADQATARWKLTAKTLDDVQKKLKGMEAGGSVSLANKDQYKLLVDQERSLQRQAKTWQAIAANRQAMFQNGPVGAPGSPPPGGAPRGGLGGMLRGLGGGIFSRATGGLTGAGGSLMGAGGVGAIEEALGPVLGTLAIAAVGMGLKGFQASLKQDQSLVNFLPRMFPGKMGGVVPSQLAGRMGAVGRPFAFNREESIATFQAMSEGGSGFAGGKLDRDAGAAMQLARMFGVDPGGEASMLASAQRSGAFQAGDAKRFAGMLAQEIKRSGLGPRFEEAQQATLMLLNKQVQELGTARPGPLMALQTAFDRTGIPGLTGMNGASVISRLQDSATHPNSEAAEALNFAVFRKMGAKSYYDIQSLQEEGLSNPKFLHSLFQMVERSAPNRHAADLAIRDYSGGSLSLHMLAALRARSQGGSLANFTGSLGDIEKTLGQGGGALLDKGAKSTTEAFPSLQIKQAEIVIHEATLAVGQPILNKVAGAAGNFARGGEKLLTGGNPHATDAARAAAGADAIADMAGLPANSPVRAALKGTATGAVKARDLYAAFKKQGALGGIVNHALSSGFQGLFSPLFGTGPTSEVGARWHADQFLPDGTRVRGGVHFEGMPAGARASLGAAMALMHDAGLHPTITSGVRTRAEQQRAYWRATHGLSRYPAARPGHSHHESGMAVDLSVPPGERARANAIMAGVGFAHDVPGDAVHYDYRPIKVQVEVNHPAFKAYVRQTNHEINHDATRSAPNTRRGH